MTKKKKQNNAGGPPTNRKGTRVTDKKKQPGKNWR